MNEKKALTTEELQRLIDSLAALLNRLVDIPFIDEAMELELYKAILRIIASVAFGLESRNVKT